MHPTTTEDKIPIVNRNHLSFAYEKTRPYVLLLYELTFSKFYLAAISYLVYIFIDFSSKTFYAKLIYLGSY